VRGRDDISEIKPMPAARAREAQEVRLNPCPGLTRLASQRGGTDRFAQFRTATNTVGTAFESPETRRFGDVSWIRPAHRIERLARLQSDALLEPHPKFSTPFSEAPKNHPFTGSEGRKLRASRSRCIGYAPANSLLVFRPLVRQSFVGRVGSALGLHRQFGGGVEARVAERLIICRTQFVT
jgi:hypothetical protein